MNEILGPLFSISECELIREELAALLKTSEFANSKRYPAFLTHVVEKTLDGQSAELKERSIGIDLFKRRPDFDTGADTVVRFTAGEVRRRLQGIYLVSRLAHRIRIDLPLGSYVPEFHLTDTSSKADESALRAEQTFIAEQDSPSSAPSLKPARQRSLLTSAVCLVLILAIAAGVFGWKKNALDQFWKPMKASGQKPLIVTGAFSISAVSAWGLASQPDQYPYLSMASTGSIMSLAGLFGRMHVGPLLQTSEATTLTDMSSHPVVLVGAYNNEWTLRLVDSLRYRFAPEPESKIFDSKDSRIFWDNPLLFPGYKNLDDYAIVARYWSRLTEGMVVVIAGLGPNGTIAATQFVTSQHYLDQLDAKGYGGWKNRNIEIVLKTSVVGFKAGPPVIVAVDVW